VHKSHFLQERRSIRSTKPIAQHWVTNGPHRNLFADMSTDNEVPQVNVIKSIDLGELHQNSLEWADEATRIRQRTADGKSALGCRRVADVHTPHCTSPRLGSNLAA
jgi:hypothetical protein